MANSHPGSYCGQDAYNNMLVTEDGILRTDENGQLQRGFRSDNSCSQRLQERNGFSGGVLIKWVLW